MEIATSKCFVKLLSRVLIGLSTRELVGTCLAGPLCLPVFCMYPPPPCRRRPPSRARLAAMGDHGGSLFLIPSVSLFGIRPDTSLGPTVNELRSERLRLLCYFPVCVFTVAGPPRGGTAGQPQVRSSGPTPGGLATLNVRGFKVCSDIRATISTMIYLPAFCRTIPTAGL